MAVRGDRHRKRFARWCNLGGKPLITLARLVDEQLVPFFERANFERVDVRLNDADDPVSGSEIQLERMVGEIIESVTFNFDKYRRPAFQIHIQRREAEAPHAFIRSGNLVRSPQHYYYFWGKPGWLPSCFWSGRMSKRTVVYVQERLGQALEFLAAGHRGPNISRPVDFVTRPPARPGQE